MPAFTLQCLYPTHYPPLTHTHTFHHTFPHTVDYYPLPPPTFLHTVHLPCPSCSSHLLHASPTLPFTHPLPTTLHIHTPPFPAPHTLHTLVYIPLTYMGPTFPHPTPHTHTRYTVTPTPLPTHSTHGPHAAHTLYHLHTYPLLPYPVAPYTPIALLQTPDVVPRLDRLHLLEPFPDCMVTPPPPVTFTPFAHYTPLVTHGPHYPPTQLPACDFTYRGQPHRTLTGNRWHLLRLPVYCRFCSTFLPTGYLAAPWDAY